MIRKIASLALAILMVGSMTSCILDPKKEPKDDDGKKKTSDYQDRTEKWHVLENIKVAYNTMEATPYISQLDEKFTFHFHSGDVGGDIPAQWDFTAESESATEMLNHGGGDRNNPVLSISLQLAGVQQAEWIEVVPDQTEFPGETWHQATVGYNFFIDTANDTQFITSGTPNAQFIVRQQPDGKWKLIRWWDLANG